MNKRTASAWFLLFRPWSYTATLVPFLVAAALVAEASKPDAWGRWVVGLVVGLLFQATVNLLNTWGDERSGVDDVPGAIRTTPQVHDGLVSMRAVFTVGALCALLAGTLGVALCFYRADDGALRFNWPLLVAGFIGFLGSTNYSTGIKFKYRGLGVPFVSFLMGPLETFVAFALLAPGDTCKMLETLLKAHDAWLWCFAVLGSLFLTLPVAALVGVIMHGNDMRDIPSDRAAGIVTLASRLGPKKALSYYRICHVLPYVVCGLLVLITDRTGWTFLIPFLCLPLTVRTLRIAARVYNENPECPKWRGLERASGGIHFVFGLLYAGALALFAII